MPKHFGRVYEFEAGYDRTGIITVKQGPIHHPEPTRPVGAHKDWTPYPAYTEHFPCDVCKREDLPVLSIDSSEDEYGPGLICLDCTKRLFEEFGKEEIPE